MDELLQEFIAETRETLDALAGEIVAWEADPSDHARLDAIFRFVHTVKGSCGFLDLPRLAALSHAAEDVLAMARDGTRAPDKHLVNAVLAVVDRIASLVETLDSGREIGVDGDQDLIDALVQGGDVAVTHAPAQRTPARTVRVNVDLLDRLMGGMSDMVLARNELARRLEEGEVNPSQQASLARLSAIVSELRDTVTRTRMQTIDALFSSLPRLVRDTAAALGKSVTLALQGGDVELDREMIEVMRDPLTHIVRNAIDHGIEMPSVRRAAGKRENGRLSISARQSGNQVVIEIGDDGAGIDTDRLIRKLIASGRDEGELRSLSDQAKLQLIFEPGLSSRDEASAVSGRGVGMDIVRASLEPLGGRIELDSVPGRGLTIALHMPLTLSIIPTLVVSVGAQRFAMPRQAVEEILMANGPAVRIDTLGTAAIATVRDRRLPLVDLAECLGTAGRCERRVLAVVNIKGGSYALAVDQVLNTEELVIKPAAPAVMASGLFAGQTLPDTGRPMLMLDCSGIAAAARLHFERDIVIEDTVQLEAPVAQALMVRDLDGELRAVPLELVDRVDTVDPTAITQGGGRKRLTIEGRLVPATLLGDLTGHARVTALRLTDGRRESAYLVAEPIDIIDIPAEIVAAEPGGPVLAVALVADETVELLDPHWLFTGQQLQAAPPPDHPPLCRIDGDDPWSSTFLRPLLEQAGYRVVSSEDEAEGVPDISLGAGAADVKLRAEPSGQEGVYRLDRAGILAAVAERLAKRKAS